MSIKEKNDGIISAISDDLIPTETHEVSILSRNFQLESSARVLKVDIEDDGKGNIKINSML